jgi:hypothetical protein
MERGGCGGRSGERLTASIKRRGSPQALLLVMMSPW